MDTSNEQNTAIIAKDVSDITSDTQQRYMLFNTGKNELYNNDNKNLGKTSGADY